MADDSKTPTDSTPVCVIGGGIAGSEAAFQLAARGIRVKLYEMRPIVPSPAHHTGDLAELVCSNSFKGEDPSSASGELKRELDAMGSMILQAARDTAVPAGAALAVDRARFSAAVASKLDSLPLLEIIRGEVTELPDGPVIIATGPLTSPGFEPVLTSLVGEQRLAFFDAAAPIVEAESLDRDLVFAASRYGKGEGADYLNCPLDRKQYSDLVQALVNAERVHLKTFESKDLFQACQPVEEIARSGADALRFGPLKPVGLTDPRTGERPWAVVQLRAENADRTAYNLVGFQTNLTFPEQDRVFRMIPGLAGAQFARHGVMHRNTFVDAPRLLDATLALRSDSRVRLAGQITGTEGYLEAASTGLLAGVNTAAQLLGMPEVSLPQESALGALVTYATDSATSSYQPMHVNWGIVPPLPERVRGKRERYAAYGARAWASASEYVASHPAFVRGSHER